MANPFDDLDGDGGDFLQEAPPPGLLERFQLNFEAGNRQNTIAGATFDAATEVGRADRARFDRRYDSFPEWQGILDGGAALSGQILGTAASPENFIPVGLGEKILVSAKQGVTGLWARIFSGAVDAAAFNAVSDAAIQGIEIAGGNRESFDPVQYGAGILLGLGIGGAAGGIAGRAGRGAEGEGARAANVFDDLDDAPAPIAATDNVAAPLKPDTQPADLVEAPPAGAQAAGGEMAIVEPSNTPEPPRENSADRHPQSAATPEPFKSTDEVAAAETPPAPETIGEGLSSAASSARGVGPFGPVSTPEEVGDWTAAVRLLSEQKTGEIPGMLDHPELGPIDVVWGSYDPQKETGAGLAKIMGKHPEVIDSLPEIVRDMHIVKRTENRATLESADHKAVVRLDYDGESKTWLMTAFEKGRRRPPETTNRLEAEGDGPSSSPAPARENISESGDGGNIAEIDSADAGPLVAESRAAKQGEAGSKEAGDFLMAQPAPSTLAQQRVRSGGAAGATAGAHVQRVRETAEKLAKALNVTATRQGRISGGRRVLGTFDTRDGVVRVRSLDDFDVLTHEYGHHIDAAIPEVKGFIKRNSAELAKLDYDPVAGRDFEGFAEFFRLWITNRQYLQTNLPALTADFDQVMKSGSPEIAKAIDEAADAWEAFLKAPSSVAVRSTIVSAKKGGWFKTAAKELKNSGVGGTIAEVLQRAYTFLFDDLNPINRAVSYLRDLHLENTGRALDLKVTADPYKLARMSRGAYGAGHMDVMYGVAPYRGVNPASPSLRDAIVEATGKPNALSGWDDAKVTDFGSYLWSRRALGEWERYRKGEIPNAPDKLTEADHKQNVAELEKANPSFVSAADKAHQFARALWKKKFDAGLIDQETHDRGLLIKDYVPGLRDFSTSDADMKVGGNKRRGDSMKGGFVKRFQGSKRDVINPLESMAADAYETSMAIARNDVIKALHRLALNAGLGGGRIAEIIPAKELRATMVDPIEAVETAAKNAGLSQADIVVMRDALESAIGEEKAAIFRPAMINEKGEPIVWFRDGGQLKALRLADGKFGRDMYKAITGMSPVEKNFWLELVAMPARLLRAGITLSPEFIGANFVRDQVMASVMYGKPFRRVGATLQGATDDLIGSEVARSYSRMFGISGGSETASLSKVMAERDISKLARKGWVANRLTSFHGFLSTAEIAETATRVGLFRTFKDEAKARGLSDYEALFEAAWRARDYLDFDRRGSGMAALAKVTPFLNASLQGLDKASRHMIAPVARKILGQAQGAEDARAFADAWKTWARLGTLVTGSISLYALMSQHEDHDEISETTRATHWMVKAGEKWVAIPKPFEHAIAINLGEALYDSWARKDPSAMQRWRDSMYMTLIPPNVIEGNPAIKSYFELKSNKDFFTDAPIVPDQLQGLEPWLQYTARSSALSKQLGYLFDEPPVIIDHLITAHLGSWGRNLVSLYDLAQPDAPGFAWDDAPISRRFIKDASKGAQSVTKFWDLVGEREGTLEGKVKSWKAMAEAGDLAGAADYFARLPPIDKAYVAVSSLDADARRLHPMIRARGGVQAIGTVRRELASGRMVDGDGSPIHVTPAERTAIDDILSSLSMAMARNGLKEAGVAGWAQRSEIDEETFYRELEATSPEVAARLGDAFAEKRVWNLSAVKAAWPELRERALQDGSNAFTGDLVAIVKASGLALDGRKRGRKKKPELQP